MTGDLSYVSHKLGHGDVAVTARHYARWIESEENRRRQPRTLNDDELKPDLLADLPPTVGLREKV